MTWLQVLSKVSVLSSLFIHVEGEGTQNDNMHLMLTRITYDNKGTLNDLFFRQAPLTREMLIAILEARIRRRLA